jgi:GTPase
VGFIRDLPKDLFAAFRSTFEEAADADLILDVVDAGDDSRDEHMETTTKILAELELDEIPRVVVFNKADMLAPFAVKLLEKKYPNAIVLSAIERETTRPLLARIALELADRWHDSAKVPEPIPTEPMIPEEDSADGDALDEMTPDEAAHEGSVDEGATLDDLLRITGRRVKRAAPVAVAPRPDKVH